MKLIVAESFHLLRLPPLRSALSCTDGQGAELSVAPITMIVPLAAGGPTDTLARIVAERMRASLGHPSLSKT